MKHHILTKKLSILALSLLLLPGCNWLKKLTSSKGTKTKKSKIVPSPIKKTAQSKSSGTILCSINGEPVIRESDFKKNVNQMLQSNPYFKGAGADALPAAIKRKLFDELVKQELIVADATTRNIYADDDFIKAYENMITLVKRSLAVQFFEKRIYEKISISDDEVTKHYEDNKNRFVKVAGGVLVTGAKFSSAERAAQFLGKVEQNPQAFEQSAKTERGVTVKNFGRVNKQAGGFGVALVPAPIKEAALATKKFPHVEKIKVGKDHWVIAARDKKETKYFNLDEIKPQIKGMIKNSKFKQELDKEIKSLKGTMTVNVNENYFKGVQKEISENNAKRSNTRTALDDSAKKEAKKNKQLSIAA